MKRLLLLLGVALAVAQAAIAPVSRDFGALAATGATSAIWATANEHTVAYVPTGAPSACTLRLEGSLDNVHFFDLSGSQDCTASAMFHVTRKYVTYIRINLLTLSGGTSPTVAVLYLGVE